MRSDHYDRLNTAFEAAKAAADEAIDVNKHHAQQLEAARKAIDAELPTVREHIATLENERHQLGQLAATAGPRPARPPSSNGNGKHPLSETLSAADGDPSQEHDDYTGRPAGAAS